MGIARIETGAFAPGTPCSPRPSDVAARIRRCGFGASLALPLLLGPAALPPPALAHAVTEGALERGIAERLEFVPQAEAADPAQVPEGGAWWLPAGRVSPFLAPVSAILAALSSGLAFLYVRRTRRALIESRRDAWQLANCDSVCGLANRLNFADTLEDEIRRAKSKGGKFALFVIGLDRFAEANERFGHEAGDRIIGVVADRITGCLGDSDMPARLAGAEFAVLARQIAAPSDADGLARKLLAALQPPLAIDERALELGPAVGIALFPGHGDDREELLRAASLALRRARSRSGGRFAAFDKRMEEELRVRQSFDEEMRSAMKSDALVLYYQPIWRADGKRMAGVEASVGWQNAEKGPLPRDEFVRFAEEAGLGMAVGEWILRRACLDALRWPHLKIAVDILPGQFRHPGFLEQIGRILADTGLAAERLKLELSEAMVVAEPERAEAVILGLRTLGVAAVLDNFGTHSASLIYLRRFDFDRIKLDNSFFADMEQPGEATIIAHSAVHLARALGLTVTAEGIDSTAQHRFLQALGCHEMQGSLFSPPVSAANVEPLLDLDRPPAERAAVA